MNDTCSRCGQPLSAGAAETCPACAAKSTENITARPHEPPSATFPEEEELTTPAGIPCPSCGNNLRISQERIGRQVWCAACGENFLAKSFIAAKVKRPTLRMARARSNVGALHLVLNWLVVFTCIGLIILAAAYVFLVAEPPGPRKHFSGYAVRFALALGAGLGFSLLVATGSTIIRFRKRARLTRGTLLRRWGLWACAVFLCAVASQPLTKALIRMRYNRVTNDIVGTWQNSDQQVTFYPDGTGETVEIHPVFIGAPQKRQLRYEILPDGRHMTWDEGFPTKSHRLIKFSDNDHFECWEDFGFEELGHGPYKRLK